VLLNEGDLTYAKIRLDERSLATLISSISTLDDSLARALCWGAAWDMTRDAEMSATDFVSLVLQGVGAETDLMAVSRLPMYAKLAVDQYSAPATRADLRATWEQGVRDLLEQAEPGSDHQLAFARAYAAAAHSDEALAYLESLLDGSTELTGLTVDTDLRWSLLSSLAANGRADGQRIDEELARDNTITGQEHAAAARAMRPTPEAKEQAWTDAVVRDDVPNETQRSIALAFHVAGQDELLAPYVGKYLDSAAGVWEKYGVQRASVVLEYLFPRTLANRETLDTVTGWLESSDANPAAKRYVREGAADIERALAAQARDAEPRG